MKTENVKGFNDYTGAEALKRAEIKKVIEDVFGRYSFEPAETPVVEYEEFVKGENEKDEAVSDIFKLQDKGKRKLALRYEFTFQLKRIMKDKKLPYKRYSIGPVFRDEPTSGGKARFRQFTQCDADIIGSDIKDEAEVLSVALEIFKGLGVKPVILFNNRALLNEILEDNEVKEKDKEFVLREIDKYDKLPEKEVKNNLKKFKAEKVLDALKKGESYFKKFESYKNVISLIEYCKLYGVKIVLAPTVIRGLSYYNGSVFEIKKEGMKETLVAGGSYEFNGVQCTGISFGLERIALVAKVKEEKEKYLVISLEQDREAVKIANKLREKDKAVSVYYGKPSKALEYANSYCFKKVVFVGSREVKAKKFKIKDMDSGKDFALKL